MKYIARYLSIILITSSTIFFTLTCMADSIAKTPAASEFYPLVGKWHGKGELGEPGKKPVALKLSLACQKVSSGWAIACSMRAKNGAMVITESDLMGVDPVTGKAHWYAITNQGETHDHIAQWSDARTMKAHYDWTQEGKKMQENIVFTLKGKNNLTFQSVVSMDGQKVGEFSGTVKR